MGDVVCGIGMSHAPGILGWPDAPAQPVRDRIAAAVATLRTYLGQTAPEVLIAFLDDHFDNHFRNLMPVFALGVADSHTGPGEHYFEMLRLNETSEIPSDAGIAEDLLRGLVHSGFDVARMGRIEYGNNLMVPLHLIRPEMDIPIVPVFINVFTPPLASVARTYELGQRVRQLLAGRPERVGFIATGGLSHWPPIWNEKSPADDAFLARMKHFQTEGRSVLLEDPDLLTDLGKYEVEMAAKGDQRLVNEEWDREFLRLLAAGDVKAVTGMSYDEVEEDAGHGGHEMLNWVALMGAMNGQPAKVVAYEPVEEWICGMAFTIYPPGSMR
jgi:2,3-dihydroxyphenylpropionate 1,2-dioxygenase